MSAVNSTKEKINILILVFLQAGFVSATIIAFTYAGLVGKILSNSPTKATIPIAMTGIGTLLFAFPASILMRSIGRKLGFIIGTLFGIVCGIAAFFAIEFNSFIIFCAASFCMGIYQAFAQYYRFCAFEIVDSKHASHAISLVLIGGVIGAIIGPMLGLLSYQTLPFQNYAAPYLAVSCVSFFALIITMFLNIQTKPILNITTSTENYSRTPILQRKFIIALGNACIGYFLMSMLMTATPLSMAESKFSIAHINFIIQWHLLSMYIPSFFTGIFVSKFGVRNVFFAGITFLGASSFFAYMGNSFTDYALALISLGIGWNFMYVTGSILLSTLGKGKERAIFQGINEFSIFSTYALASYLAGMLLSIIGWHLMSFICIPFLMLALVLTCSYKND